MSAKVSVVFIGKPEGKEGWPYIGYNCYDRARELITLFRNLWDDCEFDWTVLYSDADMPSMGEWLRDSHKKDAVIIYGLAQCELLQSVSTLLDVQCPIILASDMFGGEKFLLFLQDLARNRRVPHIVLPPSTDNIHRFEKIFNLLKALHLLRGRRVLLIEEDRDSGDQAHFWRRNYDEYVRQVQKILGIEVLVIDPSVLNDYYAAQNSASAVEITKEWKARALAVVEPTDEDLINSARLYLAMRTLLEDRKADAISIDCLSLFYRRRLPAYPCLGFWQLNNDGLVGACQADLESTITQLVGQFITQRPGFISDPTFDLSDSKVIYAHCVAPTKVFGFDRNPVPYKIRSHAEDRQGAALEAVFPSGEVVTTVKINILERKLALHQARSVGSMECERGCRTKLVCEADVETIIKNWDFNTFGWHRVTFFGDWREHFADFAAIKGLRVINEGKEVM